MGALNKETKKQIHEGGKPEYSGDCTLCEACGEFCPFENITYMDGSPQFDSSYCAGCSICVVSCPNNALKPKVDIFDNLLAEGAHTAYKSFRKSYFVNFLVDIADRCDCARGGKLIAEDVGFLHSSDPVAIDKASLDLINEKAGSNIFEEKTHKSPLLHIQHAAQLGMGTLAYTLIEL